MDNSIVSNIYQKHITKLYRFFFSRTLDRGTAEDLTSETFMRFVGAKVDINNLSAARKYLYGIAYNVYTDYLKQKYRFQQVVFDESQMEQIVEEYESESVQQQLLDKITQLLEQLPRRQRLVLALRLVEKMSLAQICDHLSKDMNYVKTTQKRGIKKLQKLIASHDIQ